VPILKNRGGFSDYKKIERELTSLGRARFYHNTSEERKNQTASGLQKLRFVFKTGISDTKTAFRLQIFNCLLQRLQFDLQSGISPFNLALTLKEYFYSNNNIIKIDNILL